MTRASGSLGGGKAVAMLALLLGLLAAFAAPPPAAAQAPPGVLIAAQIAEPKSLDPQVVTALNDFRILVNLYDGLVRYRPGSLEIAPALATAWTISDDGLTYTFTLRERVRFHDGTPVDAAAVGATDASAVESVLEAVDEGVAMAASAPAATLAAPSASAAPSAAESSVAELPETAKDGGREGGAGGAS